MNIRYAGMCEINAESQKVKISDILRWLNTVFLYKMENSRFRSVFLDCYYLMNNKEYRTDVKP